MYVNHSCDIRSKRQISRSKSVHDLMQPPTCNCPIAVSVWFCYLMPPSLPPYKSRAGNHCNLHQHVGDSAPQASVRGFNIQGRDALSLRSVWSDSRLLIAEGNWLCYILDTHTDQHMQGWISKDFTHSVRLTHTRTYTHSHCRGIWLDLVCRWFRSARRSLQQQMQRPMLCRLTHI